MKNLCKGCHTYINNNVIAECEHVSRFKNYICPCSKCLLKPVCVIGCDPYNSYLSAYIKHLKDKGEEYNPF